MLDETISSLVGLGTTCIVVDVIGKDNYTYVVGGLGAIAGGAMGYMACGVADVVEDGSAPDPLICGAGGAVVGGAIAGVSSYIVGSVAEAINPYIKENLK